MNEAYLIFSRHVLWLEAITGVPDAEIRIIHLSGGEHH
jgi:hypothetical protein